MFFVPLSAVACLTFISLLLISFVFNRCVHTFYNPVLEDELAQLMKQQFSPETNKKKSSG